MASSVGLNAGFCVFVLFLWGQSLIKHGIQLVKDYQHAVV